MANLLATAFVAVKLLSSGIATDLTKELEKGSAAAGAAGSKAGKSWVQGFQGSKLVEVSKDITEAAAGAGAESVMMAVKFNQAMTRISTQAGVAQSKLKGLSDGILKLAPQVGEGPDALADSLYHVESSFASVGISGQKAMQLVRIASEGARVGGADLTDVTNALDAAIVSGIPGVQNYQQAMGALNAVVGAGDMKMQDLADAFGTGMLATVKQFGVSLKDVGAALAVFGDNNIRGAKAGTDLRMAIQALASPGTGPVAQDALAKLGLTAHTLATDMQHGGLIPALQDLISHMDKAGFTGDKVGGVITDAFGKKAGSGVNILVNQFQRLLSKYPDMVKGASDFGQAWAQQAATPAQKLADLKAAADALGVSLGEKLLPYVMDVVNWLSKNEDVVEKVTIGVVAFAAAITALSYAIKAVQAIQTLFSAISKGAGAVRDGAAALKMLGVQAIATATNAKMAAGESAALSATLAEMDAGAVAAAGSVGELSAAEKAAAVAGAALDAVNPLGWAAAAVAAAAVLVLSIRQADAAFQQSLDTLSKQDQAVGFNVAGYQKLSDGLKDTAGKQVALAGTANDATAKLGAQSIITKVLATVTDSWASSAQAGMSKVATAQQQAASTATNLTGVLGFMKDNWHLNADEAAKFAGQAGITGQQLGATGEAGNAAMLGLIKFANTAQGQASLAADQLATKLQGINAAFGTMTGGLLAQQGDLLGWQGAMNNVTDSLKQNGSVLSGDSDAAIANQNAVRDSTEAAVNFAQAQANAKGQMGGAISTIQQQIVFLQSLHSNTKLVNDELAQLKTIEGQLTSKYIQIQMTGTGRFSITSGSGSVSQGDATVSAPGTGSGTVRIHQAAGGMISGGIAGRDSVPILAMPGEVVVPTHMVQMGAVDHLKGRLPGFAAGGLVPSYSGAPGQAMGQWAAGNADAFTATMTTAMENAMKAAVNVAVASYGAGPGGGTPNANALLAQKLMPAWATGAEWTAWNSVAMRESGWSQYARNASSGAYGIPQALPASKMGAAANPPQSNPSAQIQWMIGYIQGRYKDPIGAWAHEMSAGWYGKGGKVAGKGLMPIMGMPGELIVPRHMVSGGLVDHLRGKLPGFAAGGVVGGPVKAPAIPSGPGKQSQASLLKELAADVARVTKLENARNKASSTRSLAIDAQELFALQHPGNKGAAAKLSAMQSALAAYRASSIRPIDVLSQEIGLLRALTGNPVATIYGGAGPAAPASTDTSSTDSSAAAASTAPAAPPPPAPPASAFAGATTSPAGIAVGTGATFGASLLTGQQAGSQPLSLGSPWQFGSTGPAVSSASGPADAGISALISRLDALIAISAQQAGQITAGTQSVMTGVGSRARMLSRYRTR